MGIPGKVKLIITVLVKRIIGIPPFEHIKETEKHNVYFH